MLRERLNSMAMAAMKKRRRAEPVNTYVNCIASEVRFRNSFAFDLIKLDAF